MTGEKFIDVDGIRTRYYERGARGTPDARMYIFDRAGHFSYREHPAEFNDKLRGFIQRLV